MTDLISREAAIALLDAHGWLSSAFVARSSAMSKAGQGYGRPSTVSLAKGSPMRARFPLITMTTDAIEFRIYTIDVILTHQPLQRISETIETPVVGIRSYPQKSAGNAMSFPALIVSD